MGPVWGATPPIDGDIGGTIMVDMNGEWSTHRRHQIMGTVNFNSFVRAPDFEVLGAGCSELDARTSTLALWRIMKR